MALDSYAVTATLYSGFNVIITDPCPNTVIDALVIPEITIVIPTPGSALVSIIVPGNSISRRIGDTAFCGAY